MNDGKNNTEILEDFTNLIFLEYYLVNIFNDISSVDKDWLSLLRKSLISKSTLAKNHLIVEIDVTNLILIDTFLHIIPPALLNLVGFFKKVKVEERINLDLLAAAILYRLVSIYGNKDQATLQFLQDVRKEFLKLESSFISLVEFFQSYNYKFYDILSSVYKENNKVFKALPFKIFKSAVMKILQEFHKKRIRALFQNIDKFEHFIHHFFTTAFNSDIHTKVIYLEILSQIDSFKLSSILDYNDILCFINLRDSNVILQVEYKSSESPNRAIFYVFKEKEFYKVIESYKRRNDPFFLYLLYGEAEYFDIYVNKDYVDVTEDSIFYSYVYSKLEHSGLEFLKILVSNFLNSFILRAFDSYSDFISHLNIYLEDQPEIIKILPSSLPLYTKLNIDDIFYFLVRNPFIPRKIRASGIYKGYFYKIRSGESPYLTKINEALAEAIQFYDKNKGKASFIPYEKRKFYYVDSDLFRSAYKKEGVLKSYLAFIYFNYKLCC